MSRNLKAVLFDVDDTLFPSSEFAEMARQSAVRAMVDAGLEVEFDLAMEELLDVVAEFTSNYGNHFDQLVVRLGDNLRDGVHRALVVAAGVRAYHDTKAELRPFPDAVRCIDELRKTNLQRGILTTIYARGVAGTTLADVRGALERAYGDEPFVALVEGSPETRWVVGSNRALISAHFDERTSTAVLISAIDNLVKGAAGQAVQVANLMLGLEETAGLPLEGWMP